MKQTAKAFYTQLADGYAEKIRQLVPMYDDMVHCIVELLRMGAPEGVLDLGAGVGNLSQIILQNLPHVRITAVEAAEELAAAARQRFRAEADRVTIVQADILEFSPEEPFDAAFSNLVLHNIPFEEKRRLLRTIMEWLRPGGAFVWGDLIRYSDPRLQAHFVRQRMDFALAEGCPSALVMENFEKEAHADFPLTVEETLHLAKNAGFRDPQIVWTHDTFAVFFMRTPEQ